MNFYDSKDVMLIKPDFLTICVLKGIIVEDKEKTMLIDICYMSELRTMDLASILFYSLLFYFYFIFSYLVENKMKKIKHDIIMGHMIWSQNSHNHVIQRRV